MKQDIVTPEEVGMSSRRLERIRPAMQAYVTQKKIAGAPRRHVQGSGEEGI